MFLHNVIFFVIFLKKKPAISTSQLILKNFVFLSFIFNIMFINNFVELYAFEDYPYGVNFQIIRQPLVPLDNSNLNKKGFSFRTTIRHMNVWSRQQNYYTIDGEESQVEGTFRYGLTEKISTGIAISYLSQGGGIFDATIERIHSMSGVTQGGRDQYPGNKINVSYEPYGKYYGILDDNPIRTYLREYDIRTYPRNISDPPFNIEELARSRYKDYLFNQYPQLRYEESFEIVALSGKDRTGAGNPRYFLEWNFFPKYFIDRAKVGFQVKIPSVNNYLFASPGFDQSLFIVFEKSVSEKITSKIGFSYTKFGVEQFFNFQLYSNQYILRFSNIYKYNDQISIFSEYVLGSPAFINFGRLSQPSHQISAGLKVKVNQGIFSVGISEDLINFSVAPDIGVFASFESRLGK